MMVQIPTMLETAFCNKLVMHNLLPLMNFYDLGLENF